MKIDWIRKICILSLPPVLLLLTGCCRILGDRDHAPYRVVTQVHVVYENGALATRRQFFQQGSIRQILDYLRFIDPYGIPYEDPAQAEGRNYYITLVYSDGSQRVYHQRADMYMRIDGGPWKRIDPQKALILSGLFGMMPGDAVPAVEEPVPPLIRPQI